MDILCPHCEKPLGAEHDEKACRRGMSRRIFFGVCLAPLAAKIAAKTVPGPIQYGMKITMITGNIRHVSYWTPFNWNMYLSRPDSTFTLSTPDGTQWQLAWEEIQ